MMGNPLISSGVSRGHIVRNLVINQTFKFAVKHSVPMFVSTDHSESDRGKRKTCILRQMRSRVVWSACRNSHGWHATKTGHRRRRRDWCTGDPLLSGAHGGQVMATETKVIANLTGP